MSPPDDLLESLGCEADDAIADFRWTQATTTKYFLGLAALTAFWLALVGVFAWLGFTHEDPNTRLAGLIGFVFLGLAVLSAWDWTKHYRTTATRVFLYENGLVWYTPAAKWGAGRWDDAVTFHRWENDLGSEQASRCWLTFRDGKKVTFALQLENYHGLAAHVQDLMHRSLYPKLKAQFDAGKSVQFGQIVINQSEFVLKPGGGSVGWKRRLDQIREAQVNNGALYLNHITNRTDGFMMPLADIPNYTVLIALLPFVPKGWTWQLPE